MGDPLSVTANLVALIGFAGQSCRLLFEFFQTVSEAPKEIQQQITALKALSSTFAGIQTLGQHMPAELAWSSEFRTLLLECMTDLRATETKMKKLNEHLERGRMRRTWARLKWPSSDLDLRKFFGRVQTYHTAFSLDLLTLHIKSDNRCDRKMSLLHPPATPPDSGSQQASSRMEASSSGPVYAETRSVDALPSISPSTIAPRLSRAGVQPDIRVGTTTEVEMIQASNDCARTPPSHGYLQMLGGSTSRCLQGNEKHLRHLTLAKSIQEQPNSCEAEPTSVEFDLHKSGDVEFDLDHRGKAGAPLSSIHAPRLLQLLHSQAEPVAIRSCASRQWEAFSAKAHLWLGPVVVQRWNIEHQKPIFQAMRPSEGYGIAVALASTFGKVTIAIYFLRKHQRLRGQSVSVQWNLSFARQVRKDAKIIHLARTGDIAGMKWLFQKGRASPSDVTPDGTSLLHIAAKTNHVEMVKLLIQEGADVNAPDEDGETPLHTAVARAQDYNVSRVLIENGADIVYCNIDGKTPLHTLFNEVVGAILQYHGDSIDGEVRDGQGMTLLHFVAWSSKSEPRICRQYVERCSDPTGAWSKDNEGRSILHLAAQRGNAAMVKYILGLVGEPNVNCRDQHGRTALSYAAETKRTEVIEMLRACGGNIRDTDCRGRTILHHAARRGNLAAVEKLIALGAADDVWSTDKNGATPMQLAYHRPGATPVIECLQELQSTILENDVVCKSQSRNVLPKFGVERDTQPQLQRLCTSEDQDQGTGGTLRHSLVNLLFPKWDRSTLAKNFIFMVFAALLWEWLRLSVRLAPV